MKRHGWSGITLRLLRCWAIEGAEIEVDLLLTIVLNREIARSRARSKTVENCRLNARMLVRC